MSACTYCRAGNARLGHRCTHCRAATRLRAIARARRLWDRRPFPEQVAAIMFGGSLGVAASMVATHLAGWGT